MKKTIAFALTAMLTIAPLAACQHAAQGRPPQELSAASDNPAARGNVSLADAGNGNTSLHVEVHHLAEPQKLTASATTFVVWAQSVAASATPQNLGAMSVDGNLDGQLTTVTPLRNFDVFITAEPSATVSEPSGHPLLSTRVSLE